MHRSCPLLAKAAQRGSAGLGLPETLSASTIDIIKATAPAVAPRALDITSHFYGTLFPAHPELFSLFNEANQKAGTQPRALANSIVAYASHIENLGALLGPHSPVDIIAHKLCGLNVSPDHYPIVHDTLMDSIGEVLGGLVTPDFAAAWSESVLFLAKILIDREEELYTEAEEKTGGWRGFQTFTVSGVDDVGHGSSQAVYLPRPRRCVCL